MGGGWGKVYVFNATEQNAKAYFNNPPPNRFVALRGRTTPPYSAPKNAPIPRGPGPPGMSGVFWNTTSARFEDEDNSWSATYTLEVPTANDHGDPVSRADDLVLYVFRKWVVLYDTHGFKLQAAQGN